MNLIDYNNKAKSENKNQIAIDFDGVIHKNSKGLFDGTIYDKPIQGTDKALQKLSKKYKIIIFTCKSKPDRPLINGKTGNELIKDWLSQYNLLQYVHEITCEKPRASVYIDDNGYRFESWEDTLSFINEE